MVDLDFAVEGAEAARHTATPTLLFKLRLTITTSATPVQNVMLQCRIRIEPTRRHYAPSEHEPLSELFGTPDRWGTTLHSMLWTHLNVLVPRFDNGCTFNLPVPCSYDFTDPRRSKISSAGGLAEFSRATLPTVRVAIPAQCRPGASSREAIRSSTSGSGSSISSRGKSGRWLSQL
jgi:hypothetical protein